MFETTSFASETFTRETFEGKIGHALEESVAETYENGKKIYMQITTGSVVNIKPELIIEAFCKYAGIEFQPFAYQIHRIEVYADLNADSKCDPKAYGKNRKLVSLESFGHVIGD